MRHSPKDKKLFWFPFRPLYVKLKQVLVSVLKYHLFKTAVPLPLVTGNRHGSEAIKNIHVYEDVLKIKLFFLHPGQQSVEAAFAPT